mmetsp:Transcript_31755/g.46839  ORF Transcript_31755/g.46839 Transcript_31755/m.46839 type:complete len:653 (-) Transcript_31755:41-1999(-)
MRFSSMILVSAPLSNFAFTLQKVPSPAIPKVMTTTQLYESSSSPDQQQEDAEDKEETFEEAASKAEEWMEQQQEEQETNEEKAEQEEKEEGTSSSGRPKKYVVVGGGWGGWGAAQALCESSVDCEVTLLDALPDPTGSTPYLSKTGKPVEAGTRGFWKDYPNINALCAQLGLKEDNVFTPYTNSSFYSPDGLEATAPVFSEATLDTLVEDLPFGLGNLAKNILPKTDDPFPQLPSPLGQVLATFPLFERIPLADRASMVGLLLATIDCLGAEDESVQMAYDRMTAHDLFIKFGLSKRLVDDFIRPTLLVGLFKPPEELSALVVMELLYYYALAHQDSFDVRWIKNGTVSESLVAPLAEMLQTKHNLNVMGGCRVGEISLKLNDSQDTLQATTLKYTKANGKETTINNIDGIILALGCKGMSSVIAASPDLAKLPTFSKAASLKGIDVISTRIWFDKKVETRTPANVFAKFDELRGSGGTFFMLDQLQPDHESLWGGEDPQGSVVACDFYNAGALLSLSDDDLISILTDDLLPSAVPKFRDAKVVDSWVGKYAGTVSWFSPGSYTSRPPLEGAGSILPNVKCAGDWVRMGDKEHGAKGLCQERAYVSGMEAANSLLGMEAKKVLPVRDDEEQFKMGVAVNNQIMKVVPRFWVR